MTEQNINPISVPLPDPEKLGPAMSSLSENQRAFVVAWFWFGDRQKAAAAAGYSTINNNTLAQGAYRLWHNPKIQAAIHEYAETGMHSLIPAAIAAMEEILKDKGHKDYAKAAMTILDRTGFHATTEQRVVKVSDDSKLGKIERLVSLAKQMGIDPKVLIGRASDVSAADMKVIEHWEAPKSSDGLEDLL